ncbi:hypothetical protein TIFTF001_029069 [Ficus carica]|uniref:Uncharacterized protein n=1 Tax=Ficus carica TaxID=3494 RepID=A0AA88DR65_FICCA|nr:hypothetical protein TIFTF001_029069 [Ficus carica]
MQDCGEMALWTVKCGMDTYRKYLMQDCGEMALWTVKCGMDTATVMVWVRKGFMYDGNKLPRVVPTRTRSGLVHGLNMIAFK